MADSIREQIISAVVDHLESWSVGNDYNHSCGINVYRARHFWEIDEAPAVSIWPHVESNSPKYGNNYNTMPVKFEALTTYDVGENSSVIIEQLLADMKRLMGQQRSATVDSLADGVAYVEGGPEEYPDSAQSVVGCSATFHISYFENRNDPYSQ